MDTASYRSFLKRLAGGYKSADPGGGGGGVTPLNEHIYPGHNCEEGKNFVDVHGQESPGIAVIKNNTGVTTGEGMNTPEQGHGSIVLGYKTPEGIMLMHHQSFKRFHDGAWQGEEHRMDLSKEQIAHLARHVGLKVSEE